MKSLLVISLLSSAYAHELSFKLEDQKQTQGEILYLVFDSPNGFPDQAQKSVRQGKFPASNHEFHVGNLPAGKYAVSIIHDSNTNDRLDTGIFGIPKEALGFSQNPRIYFGPPDFEDCVFNLDQDQQLSIKLKHF